MQLPEDTSIITEEQRDWDDQYMIDSGRTYCFEFFMLEGETMEVSMTHTKATAQDLSLRCWFATKPLEATYFPNVDSMDYFPADRHIRTITLGTPTTDEPYVMPSVQMLYFMVKNMQNSDNLFRLAFNIKA